MSSGFSYEQRFEFARAPLTLAVQRLILINIAVFAVQLLLTVFFGGVARSNQAVHVFVFTDFAAFNPGELFSGFIWQPFTYMFLHGGLSHLFFNMLILFFFGPDVERVLGTKGFYRFYIICGALAVLPAALPQLLTGFGASVVGASGAVMAVLMAVYLINPERQLYIFPFPFPINMRALVFVIAFIEILRALSLLDAGGTSVATHLGGLAAGFLVFKGRHMLRLPRVNVSARAGSTPFGQRQARKPSRTGRPSKKGDLDRLGEEVDNIFKFDDKRR